MADITFTEFISVIASSIDPVFNETNCTTLTVPFPKKF